ncbi:MAG: hypothetical protein IPO15_04755, partial [Anaerolineae bacterium]|nr:hypothetical protein [Anaerolineae bacterium]
GGVGDLLAGGSGLLTMPLTVMVTSVGVPLISSTPRKLVQVDGDHAVRVNVGTVTEPPVNGPLAVKVWFGRQVRRDDGDTLEQRQVAARRLAPDRRR